MSIQNYDTEIGRIYSDKLEDISEPVLATLDYMFWGKSCNLYLLFSTEDNIQFKVSVFNGNNYSSRDSKFSFRDEALIGQEIILDLYKTTKNYLAIKSASLSK